MSTAITAPIPSRSHLAHKLEESLGQAKFKLWFQSARFGAADGTLDIAVASRFVADWIENHFHDHLLRVAEQELGEGTAVRVRIDPSVAAAISPAARPAASATVSPAATRIAAGPAPGSAAAGPRTATGPALAPITNPDALRYDLAEFIVGPSNELAYTAARQLVERSDNRFSLVFIHGGCGLGKTHLLQGLCRQYLVDHPGRSVLYTTAEQFTNEYINAVKANKVGEFRRKLRTVDVLAVDDVHFLANKTATQTEFLHTFDAMDLGGAKLVLASDCHPKLIRQFSDALVSRFMAGMVVQVQPPDVETRSRIIRALAHRRGMKLVDGVVTMLAQQAAGSVREIEGTLTKLSALAALTRDPSEADKPIGHALVHRLMGVTQSGQSTRPVRLEQIMQVVCDHLRVDRSDVLGASRHRMIVLARSVVIYLARQLTTMSYPELARALNKPNHSTIVTAAQRIEEQVKDRQSIPLVESLQVVTIDQLVEQLRRRVVESSAHAA